MKYYLILIAAILCSPNCFSFPCANGMGILYKGDSMGEVIKQCGEPTFQNTRTREIYSEQEWIYYKGNFNFYLVRMIISFRDDRVVNIRIDDISSYPFCRTTAIQLGLITTTETNCGYSSYNTEFTNLCFLPISVGDNIQTVAQNCDRPALQIPLNRISIEETEFTYSGGDPHTLIFQNGKLINWY